MITRRKANLCRSLRLEGLRLSNLFRHPGVADRDAVQIASLSALMASDDGCKSNAICRGELNWGARPMDTKCWLTFRDCRQMSPPLPSRHRNGRGREQITSRIVISDRERGATSGASDARVAIAKARAGSRHHQRPLTVLRRLSDDRQVARHGRTRLRPTGPQNGPSGARPRRHLGYRRL